MKIIIILGLVLLHQSVFMPTPPTGLRRFVVTMQHHGRAEKVEVESSSNEEAMKKVQFFFTGCTTAQSIEK